MVDAQKKIILLAEDDELLRDMYAVKFELGGFTVIRAADGQEALDRLSESRPHVVLLDVMMPRVDGFRVLQEIRKNSKLAKIPVMMLTNLGQEEDIKKGQLLGVTDYIVKANATPQQVLERVEKLLK